MFRAIVMPGCGRTERSAMPGGNARLVADHGVHLVQFYGDDDELSASVGRFLGDGLAQGHPALVVATPAHRAAFGARLGAGAGNSVAAGRLLMVDAAGLLDSFLAGGRIDPVRFQEAAFGLIGRVAEAGRPVRIYAEMVALLWDAGQVALALELEALWNDLASSLSFSLLCGYPARLMTGHDDADALEEVCRLHSEVISPRSHLPGAAGTSLDGSEAVRHFSRALRSAREARHFVLDILSSRVDQAVAVDASIITAELAANAVLHARSAFTVAVSCSAASLRISVRDTVRLEDGQPLATSPGHGLDIVARLAAKWAVEPLPGGKTVWAELPAVPLA
jgi:anti-sigma regulatory factor (Ser/Thr protein kinase)